MFHTLIWVCTYVKIYQTCTFGVFALLHILWGFSGSSAGKESVCNVEDPNLIPGLGRPPGKWIGYPLQCSWASLVAQMVKNSPAMQETWVWSLGWEDPLEEGMATHSSILALENLMDRGVCQAITHGFAELDITEWINTAQHMMLSRRREWQSTPVFLPWRIPWPEEPGGLQPRGSQRVRHNWETNTTRTHTHTRYYQWRIYGVGYFSSKINDYLGYNGSLSSLKGSYTAWFHLGTP